MFKLNEYFKKLYYKIQHLYQKHFHYPGLHFLAQTKIRSHSPLKLSFTRNSSHIL